MNQEDPADGLRRTIEVAKWFRDEGPHAAQNLCGNCGHPVNHHFADQGRQGCVSLTPPGPDSEIQARIITDDGTCLCPGYIRGALAYNLTKHLDPLVDDEDDQPCPSCPHPLSVHSEGEGCWKCPCSIDFLVEPEA